MKQTIFQISLIIIIIVGFVLSTVLIDDISRKNKSSLNPYEANTAIGNLASKVEYLLDEHNEKAYPSFYGGMYISDNQRYLIVQIVKDKIPESKSDMTEKEIKEYEVYQKLTNLNSSIKFEYVNNSYNDLERVRSKIENIISKYSSNFICPKIEITTYGINIYRNKVEVGLKENTKENQDIFKNDIIDSSLIEFREENPITY